MISLTVTLQVHPGHLDDFLTAITENAERSFTDEPGCVYFDVSQGVEDDHHFVFYELYADQVALDAHRQAPHFATWRAAADRHVEPGSQINLIAHQIRHHSEATS